MDAKHNNELVNSLLEALEERKIKIPKFASETNIPKDRIYKWIQEGTNPKADDEKTIKAWLNMEIPPYKEKKSNTELAEALSIIRQQNEFLQRLVDTNLAALSIDVHNNAAAIRAEIRGYAQRQILKEVNNNDEEFLKAKAEADKIYLLNLKQLLGGNMPNAGT